jgi:hypothetical protein
MAPVQRLRVRGGGHHAPVVPALWQAHGDPGGTVPGLSSGAHRQRPRGVRVRGPHGSGHQGHEVLRLARARRAPRQGHGCGVRSPGRRRDVGSAVAATPLPAGVRPGGAPGRGRGPSLGDPHGQALAAGSRHEGSGSAGRLGPSLGAPRGVRRGAPGAAERPPGRRRGDHGVHRGRVRRSPQVRGRRTSGRARRGPVAERSHPGAVPRVRFGGPGSRGTSRDAGVACPRARAWVCGCPGGRLPVVDASRRRNDPRKATVGR